MTSRFNEIESRIGIEPIDALLAERSELVARAASLYALFGPFGTTEHRRKVVLAVAELQVRRDVAESGEKATEGKIDAMARTHPTYVSFLDSMDAGRAEWLVLENDIQSITDRITRGNQLTRYVAAEPR
jgi:hypothetical protein